MKTRIVACCLLFTLYLYSCSSIKKEDGSTSNGPVSADSSMGRITGTTEKTPPVVNGEYIEKYPSGVTRMKGSYINGKREGQWMSFFENGKIQSEGFFKNGLRDGKAIVYFENGAIYYEGYYKDGNETGKWVFFDMQGNKINEKNFDEKPNS